MKYKALALDLDGTLINSEKKLSTKNKKAVIEAAQRGVHIILASGRPLFGIEPVAEALELSRVGGYILAYNGGNIIDCKTKEVIYSRNFPPECIHDVCTLAKEYGVYALSYDKDEVISESDTDEYVLREAKCNDASVRRVENLEQYVNYPVAKFLIAGEHEKLGLQREELIACGDGMNDISMIEYAGLGAAMENAYPPVKEKADIIAPSNDEDGVAEIIAKYF